MEQPLLIGAALVPGPLFFEIEVEGAPGFKARHRSRIVFPRDGRKPFVHEYPDSATEKYEAMLAEYAALKMRRRAPTELPVFLEVWAFKPVPKSWSRREYDDAMAGLILPTTKPDWDNHGKITDALKGIVWKDDAQVVDGAVHKRYSARPCLRIEVREFVAP